MNSDGALVQLVVAGDRLAYGLLYDRFVRLIRCLCFDATGDVHSAQDLAQEVFLRAYSNLDRLRDRERFGPWLVAMARHICADWHRSRAHDRHRFTEKTIEVAAKVTDVEEENRNLEVRRHIAKLPEKERVALHLFYLEDQPAERASRLLGLSNSAFYKLLARARTRLEKIVRAKEGRMS